MSAQVFELSSRQELTGLQPGRGEGAASAAAELSRARRRIAQLERTLAQAMRDSLANFERAREAERRLAELGHEVTPEE